MRLLNAKSLRFKFFAEDKLPPYAILSHRWLIPNEQEVSYEEITKMEDLGREARRTKPGLKEIQEVSVIRMKRGFKKIQQCCQQAIDDGLDWIWMDTCCIKQSSSTELSESINSMFRWYELATVCYAHLFDFYGSTVRGQHNEVNFQRSSWFTRAWTLQELLAPSHLVFFSSEWKDLGTKSELSELVSKATNIDQEYLAPKFDKQTKRVVPPANIRSASLAKRMTWAIGRAALRPEDIAYSLIGIFDTNMPLIYGEGEQKAFFRLQEEIMKDSDDHSLLVWVSSDIDERPPDLSRGWELAHSRHFPPVGDRPRELSKSRRLAHSRHFAFATSPEDFIGMGNIVPFASQEGDPPYGPTNRGLQISLLVGRIRPKYFQKLPGAAAVTEATTSDLDPSTDHLLSAGPSSSRFRNRSTAAADNRLELVSTSRRLVRIASAEKDAIPVGVLRCHVEHDFFNVVVIPLKPLGGDSYERDTDMPPGIVPQWRTRQFVGKTIYIKLDDEGVDQTVSYDRRHGLLIHSWPRPYQLREIYPPHFWREKDGIIQLPLGVRRSEQAWYVSMLFVDKIYGGPPFIATLGVVLGPAIEQGPGRPKPPAWPWCNLQVIRSGKFFLDDMHNDAGSALAKMNDRAYLYDGNDVSIVLKPSTILGQEMFVVEFRILKEKTTAQGMIEHQVNYDTDDHQSDLEDCQRER